jgi:hypothetical protein
MEKTIESKLEEMVGKKYDTGDRIGIVQKWKFLQPNFIIITSVKTFVYNRSNVEEYINDWKLIENETSFIPSNSIKNNSVTTAKDLYDTNTNYKTVQNKLLEMMESISNPEASANTLAKANSICNVANTMISLERLNLQVKKSNSKNKS